MHQYLGAAPPAGIVLAHQWMVVAGWMVVGGSAPHFAAFRSAMEMPGHPPVESGLEPPQSSMQNEIVVTEAAEAMGTNPCLLL